MKATAYRYNAEKREDRKFNTTGKEKNPNAVKFYARSMAYAESYKTVYDNQGYKLYDATLEVVEVEANLFDMTQNFESLSTFTQWLNDIIGAMEADYTYFLHSAKTQKDKDLWENQLKGLDAYRVGRRDFLASNEFQALSDFNYQNLLVTELKQMGFEGYFTNNEIAIF